MLPTRLGINCLDIEAWLESPAVKERLQAAHRAHLEDSVRTFGILDLPRNLTAAFDAAAEVSRKDTVVLISELLRQNNEIMAAQLDQIGVHTSGVLPPERLMPHPPAN